VRLCRCSITQLLFLVDIRSLVEVVRQLSPFFLDMMQQQELQICRV